MRYARPESITDALQLLLEPGAVPMGGGTDLIGQIDRDLVHPSLVVDLHAVELTHIRPAGEGISIGALTTLTQLGRSDLAAPYAAVVQAASQAASRPLRNVATVAGNLCQGTRCWYYRGPEWNCWLGGGTDCYAQLGDHRNHNLQPGDCISAHPSDLAPALAACGARVVVASSDGRRELALLDLYRRPTNANRSLLTLQTGELVTEILLPRPPESSTYLRLGQRAAFSFPLVGVAAARAAAVTVAASGVANIPIALDPSDPLRDLPGNPQSHWKRTPLQTLVQRAVDAVL